MKSIAFASFYGHVRISNLQVHRLRVFRSSKWSGGLFVTWRCWARDVHEARAKIAEVTEGRWGEQPWFEGREETEWSP